MGVLLIMSIFLVDLPQSHEKSDILNVTLDRGSLVRRCPLRSRFHRGQGRELALTRQGPCPEDGPKVRSRGTLTMFRDASIRFLLYSIITSHALIVRNTSG